MCFLSSDVFATVPFLKSVSRSIKVWRAKTVHHRCFTHHFWWCSSSTLQLFIKSCSALRNFD